MNHKIDARGLACPLPVVRAKNRLKTMVQGESLEVLVDNGIAVQNLTKFARVRGYSAAEEKLGEGTYRVILTPGETPAPGEEKETPQPSPKGDTVVVISSDKMGEGDDGLGRALMKAFLFALTRQEELPGVVLLYNGGARLSCRGSEVLEDLKLMEAEGVKIATCGTCLSFYGLTQELAVGEVTNMYEIVEMMSRGGKVVRP